jgi:transposase
MKRRNFTSSLKTKIVLEALKEQSSVNEIAQKNKISPQQVSNWKREFLLKAENVFQPGAKGTKDEEEKEREKLLRIIGELKVENDFLKKSLS